MNKKLCAICLIKKAIKKSEKLNLDVCDDCFNQVQQYFSQGKDELQIQFIMNIRQKIQDKYAQKGIILSDSPYFSDEYIECLHSKIKKMSSNIKNIQQ